MNAKSKFSRRQVVTAITDLLADGESSRHVAQILAAYLVKSRQDRNIELYLRDLELAITKRFGVATAYVSSVKALSDETRRQVERLVKASSGAKKVEMIEIKDPGLIGGIVVQTADAELDGSVRTKLRNLRSI